jgi:arachidonate 15-lipoxygenase
MTQAFALDYLKLYYRTPQTVINDCEIQAWADMMSAQRGMRINGFPNSFKTVEELAQVVGQIMFITTAHHASIHYPQYLFSGFVPSMPFAAYAPPPAVLKSNLLDQKYLLEILPLRQPSLTQAFIFYLTDFRMQRIGQYPHLEERAKEVVESYQSKLKALAEELDAATAGRIYPYTYLNPRHIPNSVMV